jgi:hypothetical protein
VLIPLAAVVLAAPLALADLPPAFTDMAYEPAMAANAAAEDGLLVVAFVSGTLPSRRMERVTWSDEGVIAYLKKHGITAIAVDYGEHGTARRAHDVETTPTTVVFRGGAEVDRRVGVVDAAALTDWLDAVRGVPTRADALRARAAERVWRDGKVDVRERLDIARELAGSGDDAAATAEYVWLWNNMAVHEPSMHGVRGSFMAGDMQSLARRSAAAREAFVGLRDALTARVDADEADRQELRDWLTLNIRVLDDDAAVRGWVDRVWDGPAGPDTLKSVGRIIDGWLVEHGEWAKAGVVQWPAELFIPRRRQSWQTLTRADQGAEMEAMLRTINDRGLINDFAVYHAACLAAGRDDDAWRAADALLEDIDRHEARAALCRDALRADAVRPRHAELAEGIPGTEGAELRTRIAEALDAED